jgi:hypothetical protein
VNDQLDAPPAPAVTFTRPVMLELVNVLLIEKITFVNWMGPKLLVNGAIVAVPANAGALILALGAGVDIETPGGDTVKTVTELVKAPQTSLMTSA